ncbi:MAG TPA: NTP transferase domain-containing protein [Sphingomicrobium sp.]|nr:NTP transferase domain-containing protein [Sphingomicrobium sp.]
MALGALIGAYQEDESGGLRALLPLSGRTLVEYQVRCAAAAGASPIVVLVERVPVALQDAVESLRNEGLVVTPVSDGLEAASRFEAGALVLLVGDGIVPPADLLAELAESGEPAVVTVPDDERHQGFERIDAESRWGGLAVIEARLLGSTAAMLGDWDLPSTLLRRTLQDGALLVPASDLREPLLAEEAESLHDFDRRLLVASRGARRDWASRFVLPIVEDLVTERLLETRVKPEVLIWVALLLTLAGAFAFTRGWLGAGLALLVLATPLDLAARRLSTLRLRPLPARLLSRLLLWPATGIALVSLGWWTAVTGAGWWSLVASLAAAAFAEAARVERGHQEVPGQVLLFSRRNAIIAAIPFAIAGAWAAYLAAAALYAAISFFYLQHIRHRIVSD